jgi:hypothetical protein
MDRNLLPPEREVTFWLPKLEGREEIIQHNGRHRIGSGVYEDSSFPPEGAAPEQFGFGALYREENR